MKMTKDIQAWIKKNGGSVEPPDVDSLIVRIRSAGFVEPKREFEFHPERDFRFDLAWPEFMVAFEREGGTFITVACTGCGKRTGHFRSRHNDRKGYEKDVMKYNAAALLGWRLIRATTPMMKDGRAAAILISALTTARGDSNE